MEGILRDDGNLGIEAYSKVVKVDELKGQKLPKLPISLDSPWFTYKFKHVSVFLFVRALK